MAPMQIDDRVELMQDIPELGLRRGEVGLVCSTWFDPSTAYEVEFEHAPPGYGVRALLMSSQLRQVQVLK